MLISTCLSLISVKLISAGCDIFQVTSPVVYYILVFLEGGLVSSSICLITALIGERLKMHGIFRAFAISNVIYGIGSMMAGGFFSKVPHIFWLLKTSGALLDILLTTLFWYFYKKEKLQYS